MGTPRLSPESANPGSRELAFRLSLDCPKCGASGWIEWRRLKHGLRCAKCGCSFLVTPGGQVRAQAELPQVRFSCPRCGRSGSIPDLLAVRGAECSSCRLPLARGPDRQLHGVEEAKRLRQAAAAHEASSRAAPPAAWFAPDRRPRRAWSLAAAIAVVGAVALTAGALGLFDDPVPHELARRFTRVCLSGRWEPAQGFLEDDAVQRAEFDRWRRRHLSSIVDRYRPKGDKVQIAVETRSAAGDTLELEVVLNSPHLGTRRLRQHWSRVAGQWRFDARATLAAEDGPSRSGRPPTRPGGRSLRPAPAGGSSVR